MQDALTSELIFKPPRGIHSLLSQNIIDRLFSLTKIDPVTNCWIYLGCLSHGYPSITIDYKTYRVQRLILNAKEDEQVNHTRNCPNRSCWNYEHLYIGTQSQNVQDIYAVGKNTRLGTGNIHCSKGHLLDSHNSFTGQMFCSICMKDYQREYRRKNRDKKNLYMINYRKELKEQCQQL